MAKKLNTRNPVPDTIHDADDIIYEKIVDSDSYVYVKKYTLSGSPRVHMLPHFHNAVEFTIVAKGTYTSHIDTEERLLKEGDIVFVNTVCPHFYRITGKAEVYAVVINLPTYRSLQIEGDFPRIMRKTTDFPKILEMLQEADEKWEYADRKYKMGFAYTFLGTMMRYFSCGESESRSKSSNAFLEVIRYIEEHFREDITLKFLAQKYGYAQSYFSRTFNKFAGMSLREYINRQRILEVLKIKKEHPRLPWYRAMEKVGFVSWNTFIRAFSLYSDEPLPEEDGEIVSPITPEEFKHAPKKK